MIISLLRILIIGALCGVALWQSLSFRMGGFAPNDFIDEFETVSQPESWQHMHPDHWIQLSKQAIDAGDDTAAHRYAVQALRNNVTSGGAASKLLQLYEKKESTEAQQQADTIALFTDNLWPTHPQPSAHLADYWAKRGNLQRMLPKWGILLTKSSAFDKELFPYLKTFLSDPATSTLLLPYTQNPPVWWDRFFNYLARQKDEASINTMKVLYQLRVDSGVPLNDYERRTFVTLLINKKRWQEAYFAWMGGLNREQLELSGLLFDGGFEGGSHNTGFDWRFSKNKMANIRQDITYGMRGRKALSITLRDEKRVNFNHVRQNVLLPAGNYELNGRYRLDQLKTAEGLRWRIRCIDDNKVLGESLAFIGRSPWNTFKFSFTVPNQSTDAASAQSDNKCTAQYIRLEASSPYAHKHLFQGKLWFDDLRIERRLPKKTDNTK